MKVLSGGKDKEVSVEVMEGGGVKCAPVNLWCRPGCGTVGSTGLQGCPSEDD